MTDIQLVNYISQIYIAVQNANKVFVYFMYWTSLILIPGSNCELFVSFIASFRYISSEFRANLVPV